METEVLTEFLVLFNNVSMIKRKLYKHFKLLDDYQLYHSHYKNANRRETSFTKKQLIVVIY